MKHSIIYILVSLFLLCACQGGNKQGSATSNKNAATDTLAADNVADSTIYGTSGEFGMSTFTLISNQGDTLNVCRTANDGTDGKVYGDLTEGDRYAMTLRDNGEAFGVLINLTQLEKHIKDYEIRNGQLLISGKVVEIETLNDKELKLKSEK